MIFYAELTLTENKLVLTVVQDVDLYFRIQMYKLLKQVHILVVCPLYFLRQEKKYPVSK